MKFNIFETPTLKERKAGAKLVHDLIAGDRADVERCDMFDRYISDNTFSDARDIIDAISDLDLKATLKTKLQLHEND